MSAALQGLAAEVLAPSRLGISEADYRTLIEKVADTLALDDEEQSDVQREADIGEWLQDRGYDLHTLRFTRPRAAGRVTVGLVWRRRWDRGAASRHATLTREQAAELLLGLGGIAAL